MQSRREAELPEGANVLHNPVGVAPGVVVEDSDTTYILLPGPPGEMKGMFHDSVVPYLMNRFGSARCCYLLSLWLYMIFAKLI